MEVISAVLGFIVLILTTIITVAAIGFFYGSINAYVLQTLWMWFVVPILGLKALTFAQAWGLGLIPTWIVSRSVINRTVEKSEYAKVLWSPIVGGVAVLAIGWILRHYI